MYGYIYKTTNLINNKFYIGKKASNIFLKEDYLGSGIILLSAIEKYGKENFKVELVDIANTKQELNEKEKYYINLYNSTDKTIGYNIANGGQGGDVLINRSDELNKERALKISSSLKGHTVSEETRIKLSKARKNWLLTHREEISEINKKRYENNPDLNVKMSEINKKRYENNPNLIKTQSINQKLRWENEEYRNKQHITRSSEPYKQLMKEKLTGKTKGMIIINNGKNQKKINPDTLDLWVKDGWELGTLPFSKEHRDKLSKAAKNRSQKPGSIRIKCITTNQIFNSKTEASKKLGISIYFIDKSIATGLEFKGMLFIKL